MDARTIAERLGVPEEVVRAVQRRGVLRRLDLDDAEIRERLWRGHVRSMTRPDREDGVGVTWRRRPAQRRS